MKELEHLVTMSKYAGERFDLVQAGGGNSSVKLFNQKMLIKASGFHLTELNKTRGVSWVNYTEIVALMNDPALVDKSKKDREQFSSKGMGESVLSPHVKPSIETFLHAILAKYTLHTHPIVVNAITCQNNWARLLREWFPKALLVPYETPGIELALIMKNELHHYQKKHNSIPEVIFLQNHGLIVNSDTLDKVLTLTESVVDSISEKTGCDLSRYKLTNTISKLINSISNESAKVCYFSEDQELNSIFKSSRELFFTHPFCPDKLVYCGISVAEIKDTKDHKSIEEYQQKYYELPKVIIFKDHLFFIGDNIRKAKDAEEVFKFHIMALFISNKDNNFLNINEIAYLSNWDAEKYRQDL